MSLYRNYRPKSFADVVNQEHIKKTLQNSAASRSFGHAYLFTGPRGTGKTSLARIFARAVNCLNPEKGEPCNQCAVCKQFAEGKSLDLVEIDAASNTGVENIREIIENLKFSPTQAQYKVFIIDEVHMLSKGAFNALLKTLEEPPKHAIFILATTEAYKVPATVISRTQRYDFKKIGNSEILERIKSVAAKEKIKADDQSLQLVANASEGSLRDALSILEKISSFGEIDLQYTEALLGIISVSSCQKLLDMVVQKNASAALEYVGEIFASGADPVQFNKDFLDYLRKVLLCSMGANFEFALDKNQMSILSEQSKIIKPAVLLHIIRLFLRANKDFQSSPSPELPIEIAVAESCLEPAHGKSLPPENKLNKRNLDSGSKPSAEPKKVFQDDSKILNFSQGQQNPKNIQESGLDSEEDNFTEDMRQINEDEIITAWPDIMQEIKQQKGSLFTVMKNVSLSGAQGNILDLKCSYKFHKDSIDKNRSIILRMLEQRFNTKFKLNVIIEKNEGSQLQDASSLAAEIFGGESAA